MLIDNLIALFGNENVQFDSSKIENYLQNVCGATRNILGIVYPKSENDLLSLIDLSRISNIPLYPISKGFNLGLGSRLPVEDNHLIVDLSRMNRILSFDSDLGIIEIEPGVTQQDVANYLDELNTDFILNVTGSSIHSSIIGNVLERGIGHYGSRVSEVINLNLIMGDGTKLSTNPYSNTYNQGLGPDLKGLFFQSNFGIVTSLKLRLLPKTDSIAMLTFEKKSSISLEDFVNQLRIVKQKQILPDNLHISNQARRLSIAAPLVARENNISLSEANQIVREKFQTDWAATTSLRGEKMILESHITCLQNYLSQYANISILWESDLTKDVNPFLRALKGTIGHAMGIPCSDALLSIGPDKGILFLIPALPFRGRDLINVVDYITRKFQQYDFEPYMTFNLVEQISLEGVINLTFSKSDPSSVSIAHHCILEAVSDLEELGYPPMRMSIFQKSKILNKDGPAKNLRNQLKKIFDPANIIARGRYEDLA